MAVRRVTTALVVIVAIVVVALLGACEGPLGPKGDAGETLDWSDAIESANLAEATYALGFALPEGEYVIFGTGFSAHYENIIWTNAHVVEGLRGIQDQFPDEISSDGILAVRNGTVVGGPHTYQLDLSDSISHPEYDPEVFDSPDIAAIRVEASFGEVPAFLPRAFATELRVGQPIGTFGYPEELSFPPAVVPIATFKDGTISALRPFSALSESVTPENTRVVQHNLDLSGGTSGSAIFDHNGYIVAVNYGGAGTVVGDPAGPPEDLVFVPTGNVGVAVRVDEAWKMVDMIDAGALQAEVAASSKEAVHGNYRGFPEDWNGKTMFLRRGGTALVAPPVTRW